MNLNRRDFLGLLAAAPAQSAETNRPNIILCMGDDHGWNETGYNGHPHLKTPVLDEMAAGGLRLDRFYSAHPNCSPTRGSIMTGRHPNRYGTFAPGWSIRPEEITIAQLLNKAGYSCGHFGKWHLGPVKADSPTNPGAMGFHEWLSHDNFFEVDPILSRNGGPVAKHPGESSEIVVGEALKFIAKAKSQNRPSFTVIWFGSPHEPYFGTEPYLSMYKDLSDPIRSRLAEITAMDHAIGQLREGLRTAGLRDNTLLWYCGDNGVPPEGRLTTPYRGAKGQVYEGGVRIPGIIEWPARLKARRTSVNAVTSDMLPTLCDITGIALPKRPLDGISLKPLLDGKMKERPTPIFFWEFQSRAEEQGKKEPYIEASLQEGTTPTAKLMAGKYTRTFRNFKHTEIAATDSEGPAAMLGNRFKLVVDGNRREKAPGRVRELFDLDADRGETKDLAAAQPANADNMDRELRAWQKSVLNSLTGADYSKR
ncbi:MAG: sulfatase [Bryobacteraceae bacterium]